MHDNWGLLPNKDGRSISQAPQRRKGSQIDGRSGRWQASVEASESVVASLLYLQMAVHVSNISII